MSATVTDRDREFARTLWAEIEQLARSEKAAYVTEKVAQQIADHVAEVSDGLREDLDAERRAVSSCDHLLNRYRQLLADSGIKEPISPARGAQPEQPEDDIDL